MGVLLLDVNAKIINKKIASKEKGVVKGVKSECEISISCSIENREAIGYKIRLR